jgi:hypothetical protein
VPFTRPRTGRSSRLAVGHRELGLLVGAAQALVALEEDHVLGVRRDHVARAAGGARGGQRDEVVDGVVERDRVDARAREGVPGGYGSGHG